MSRPLKPICRVGKLKRTGRTSATSVENHLTRAGETPNADPARTRLNRWLHLPGEHRSLKNRIADVLTSYGLDYDEGRRDAVMANDLVLSITPEFFSPKPGSDPADLVAGRWDRAKVDQLAEQSVAMLKERYGDRLVSAVLHLDETSPHVQAIVVPIVPKRGKNANSYRLCARDGFNAKALSDLQQAWEDRLSPLGVGPREKHSRATHSALRSLGGAMEAADDLIAGMDLRPRRPLPGPFLERPKAMERRMTAWENAEEKRLKAEAKKLKNLAMLGRLYQAQRVANADTEKQLVAARSQAIQARQEAAISNGKALLTQDALLELTKEQVGRLRLIPINEVAVELGWTGEIGPKENAIDLVKRVGGLTYAEAVQWLGERFSYEQAAQVVQQALATSEAPPVLTKSERVKAELVTQQLAALAAPGYRVTLMRVKQGPDGPEKIGQNLGKQADGAPEKVFTAAEVIAMTPRLAKANYADCNIFITPLDNAVHHVLLDDLSAESLDKLTEEGHCPATVLETSPGSHQAVLKIPRNIADKETVNDLFKAMNFDIGDESITGLEHPMRLAGFENRKEKHLLNGQYPFVRLVEAINRTCVRAIQLLRAYPPIPTKRQAQMPESPQP